MVSSGEELQTSEPKVLTEPIDVRPSLPIEILCKILEFLPYKSLQKCKMVSKTFLSLVVYEEKQKQRRRKPKCFSWVYGDTIGENYLSDFPHFQSDAHKDLYEKFGAFV